MEKFFNKMSKKIYKAIKKDAKRALKEMEGEELYSVALVTDSDCITLYMALNTYEYLETADEEYLETVTSAFMTVIEEKIFGKNSEEVTYFISTSDGDGIYEIENHSAKLLNSEKKYKKFLNRKESGEC